MRRLTVIFFGDVQGVGFRKFMQKNALALHITGTAQNLSNGSVKAELKGDLAILFSLIHILSASFSLARTEITFETSLKNFTDFIIL